MKLLPPPLRRRAERKRKRTKPSIRTGKIVLVVSDDPEIRRELPYGFPDDVEVELAHDARDGWEKLKTMTPAAVVVSIRTGRAGGWSLTHDMGTDPRLTGVPILMLLEREQDRWLAKKGRATRVRVQSLGGSDIVGDVLELISAGSPE